MPQEIRVTFTDNNEWKLPFNCALGLHLVIILGALFIPQIFDKEPLYEDIYTVDLISATAVRPEAPAPEALPPREQKQAPKQEIKQPEPARKAVSIAETPPEVQQQAELEPVSLTPLKRKKVRKVVSPSPAKQKEKLEELRQQRIRLAEEAERRAEEAERRAEEAANLAAIEAVDQLKEMLRETSTIPNESSQTSSGATQAPRGTSKNVVENQYYASIHNALQPHWKLPEHKSWNPELSATIVITISKNGRITDRFFERRSGDKVFDQFILKALNDGAPLKPIPGALGKSSLEMGLRFTVDSIE